MLVFRCSTGDLCFSYRIEDPSNWNSDSSVFPISRKWTKISRKRFDVCTMGLILWRSSLGRRWEIRRLGTALSRSSG
ncbi:hypothetical protein ACP46_gp68 [Rhizobium phage RHEph06]|uniref:Uncharacterized protein n=2 Tax=Kleczkowskavirus RHEph4 TaxID=1921526 RepID=L7TJP9_9CAUD|nr:hypothetical protein ACP46_gp68 [Rhizobium phage RHEph06]YP_009598509.1 hypothetical protein FDH25_gp67 [Rhizobium phage RHEph04]AGC35753.1 hypothetical protein RHEph04_gp067 [Rhizobium phage RHEph04]AGC35829.1 hypothetical protein RHEph05_gp062 [Rhizobium phage RHEph05]AGC35910.1 hypothetical protein RHEph06_gp068 [Rhizobium phage RHEph06]